MPSLAIALRRFQRGDCSLDDLTSGISRDLASGVTGPSELITQLDDFQKAHALDPGVVDRLRRCILDAQTRARDGAAPDHRPAAVDARQKVTVLRPARGRVQVGSVIKQRFVLEQEIGRGGMSQVFKALDRRRVEARSRDPYVAIKIMNVQEAHAAPAFIAMQREVQRSQLLNHPNIVRVNDFDREDDLVYITMELLEGESLQQKIDRAGVEGFPHDTALSIITAVANALAYAHGHGIVHADLKPSNVFVTTQGFVKVIDFGIARAIQSPDTPAEDRTVFDPQLELGALTPAYASPEMLQSEETDVRDDIYALGCVAFQLLAGRHPFMMEAATYARAHGHVLQRPKILAQHEWRALRHALEFDRSRRTPDATVFVQELTGARRRLRLPGRAPALLGVAILAVIAGGVGLLRLQDEPGGHRWFRDCPECPPVIVVRSGSATLGQDSLDDAPMGSAGRFEYPEHSVRIGREFALGTREVTVGEFRRFVAQAGGSYRGCRSAASGWAPDDDLSWENPGFPQDDSHPVVCVSWDDATRYLSWLSRVTGENYRLPSESEWEYTARAVARLPLSVSEQDDLSICTQFNTADASIRAAFTDLRVAACEDGYVFTAPADRGDPDRISDLRGNVFEWTSDCWNPSYVGAPADGSPWLTGDCGNRVLRGGSWYTAPDELRLTYRNRFEVDYRSSTFGFRVARDITARDTNEPTT